MTFTRASAQPADGPRESTKHLHTSGEIGMTSNHFFKSVSILLLLIPLASAQSPADQSAAQAEEQKKVREQRERKAAAIVEEVIRETQSLKLPENRIRIQIALTDLLWPRSEQRARALFKDAVAGLGEIAAAVDSGDPEYSNLAHLPSQLRQEMLQVVAKHDARLALDFLRSTRPTSPQQRPYSEPNIEAQLEMRIAAEVAAKDSKQALRIGEEALKHGIDYESINLLYKLQPQDKPAAEKLLGDILGRLRTEDFTKNPESLYIVLILLRTWSENNRAADPGLPRTTVNISLANLDEQAARELSGIIIDAAMNNGPGISPESRLLSGQLPGILQQLKPIMPEIERLWPDRAGALTKRIGGFEKLIEAQQGPWAKYQELIQNGTPDALLEASKTAPPEIADNLAQQAAWKAFNQGDAAKAREIVDKIADPRQRNEMTLNMDRQVAVRAAEQGTLAEARAALSRIPALEERANLLIQLAAKAAAKGDKPTAIQLLGEAQALLGYRARNYQQLGVQVQIARAFEPLDFNKSAAIVETAIDQLNELTAAASVLNGFDLQQYFRDDEFVINGGNSLSAMAQEIAVELNSISRDDFDRAKSISERFQRGEMRVTTLLEIAKRALEGVDHSDDEDR